MSTVAASPVATRRPPTITAATVLLVLLGTPASSEAGAIFAAFALAMATLRLVAAVGVWRWRR